MSTSHLVTAAMGFVIIVTLISPVLATMPLEIGMDAIKLGVDILGSISDDSSKLFARQRLMTIWYQNRLLSSFQ